LDKIPKFAEVASVFVGEVDYLKDPIYVFIRLSNSIMIKNFSETNLPIKFIFYAIGPRGTKNNMFTYREIGACMATLFSDELFQTDIYEAEHINDILSGIDEFLSQSIIIPPGEWDTNVRLSPPANIPSKRERLILKQIKYVKDKPHISEHDGDPGLQKSSKFCGGLISDIKRKIKWYPSDFKDALNFQMVPAVSYLYFACLTPIITFGGLLSIATGKNMAAMESLLSGLICGTMFALFAGQPMTILGSTGPVLVFEKILYDFSLTYKFDYMGFRCLVGCWIFFFLSLVVVFNLSYLVKYFTRFTGLLFDFQLNFDFIYY
jgi:hypothetical protein